MDLEKITLFGSMGQRMKWLNERQKVLAQNIANANTPGYIPKDLKNISFTAHLDTHSNTAYGGGSSAAGLKMTTAQAGHLGGSGGGSVSSLVVQEIESKITSTTPDGNAVNLEDELIKMADTQMDYTMAVNLYKKHVGMMKIAIGRRG
jgi:flagellar basal-body rod protein FlgB